MKKILFLATIVFGVLLSSAQTVTQNNVHPFSVIKQNAATPVKNQAITGTCWCFSTTSLVESECLRKGLPLFDISEMFIVRNIYIEKATNYILRQGHAQFSEGGLGHDLIRGIATYGAMPENVFSGLPENKKMHNHSGLEKQLKGYLDSVLLKRPIDANWKAGFQTILDKTMGVPPAEFEYNGKNYTPLSFAKEVMLFDENDYVNLTSFLHHTFYKPFILEAPDNFSNGMFYNIPLNELIDLTEEAISNGYTIMWDADVSNDHFDQGRGLAMNWLVTPPKKWNPDAEEATYTPEIRQDLYMNLTTQDDHLMHITGLAKTSNGKIFFIVKNSWGEVGPYKGSIHVSKAYFAMNTVSLVLPKAAINKALLKKLQLP